MKLLNNLKARIANRIEREIAEWECTIHALIKDIEKDVTIEIQNALAGIPFSTVKAA